LISGKVFWVFSSEKNAFPQGGVVADAHGNLFGTTTSGGTGHNGVVYALHRAGAGGKSWTQNTLYAFTGGNDGGIPMVAPLVGAGDALYGTAYAGGSAGEGVVYKLTPPAKGTTAWTEHLLWTFSGGNDGSEPTGALIQDSAGNLYGTTTGGGTGVVGTVFELSPPTPTSGGWTETVLYNFTGNNDGGEPYGQMLLASDGNLYGTTAGYGQFNYGTIFRLTAPTAPGGSWGFSVLHAFAGGTDGEVPRNGLIQGPDGTLYGATAGFDTSYGNVFSLNTDGSAYKVLWTVAGGQGFTGNGPWQNLSLDTDGTLYGATFADGLSAQGEVFRLRPPASGKTKWSANILHVFQPGNDPQFPYSTVLIGPDYVYGSAEGMAGQSGFYPGNVWRIQK
jgi:uncharacterized repeat protein (TIGR03803 family)